MVNADPTLVDIESKPVNIQTCLFQEILELTTVE